MNDHGHDNPVRPSSLFPLIRHLSYPVTILLLRTPMTANQATFLSMIPGLAASYFLFFGGYMFGIVGSVFLFFNYLLDHCDGEIARARGLSSRFGHEFDTFVDWIVHTSLFAAMGYGALAETGQDIWLWFGLAAAIGGTINYALSVYWRWRKSDGGGEDVPAKSVEEPEAETLKTMLIVAFREFARADFWVIVLALALMDWMRYLLPFAAVGAQVYWILQFTVRGNDQRV